MKTSGRMPTSITIDRHLWREFKIRCATDARTTTEQMERLIRSYLNRRKPANPKPAA